MQRVRVGAIGLAAVFLLVLLATSLFGFLRKDSGTDRRGDTVAVTNAADAPKEPLAELGVAPGNAPETGTTPAPARPKPPGHPASHN